MKKKFLFLMALLAVSLLALAEMTIFVYQKDGEKVKYLAANVDSIGFVNFHTIVFDANGGDGSMDALRIKESESVNLPANIFTKSAFAFTGWNAAADGSGTAYTDQSTITPTTNMTLYAQWESTTSGIADGHEWVDLGLPSGTKWATMNVGADSPEDYGDYFACGETTPKSSYTGSNYNYLSNPTTLPLERDAAYTNWGTSWRMPTLDELNELINTSYTTCTWTTQNGVKGYKVTSKTNGHSIFLPAAGYRLDSDLHNAGSYGYCWSSSLLPFNSIWAYELLLYSGGVHSNHSKGEYGVSVRPILRELFTLGFDANGGIGSMSAVELERNESINISANTFTRHGYRFIGWNTAADGSGTAYTDQSTITPTSNVTLYAQWENITSIYVDLGLPSGTKWATKNVGANSPEDFGDYFAWGETTPKSTYDWRTYIWCNRSIDTMTKYCTSSSYGTVDNKTTLDLSDDAAYVNWGGDWRMPTNAELNELKDNCTCTWTTQNGVKGYKVTSQTNGNSIFWPAAGYRYDSSLSSAGSGGDYWSSSLDTNNSNYAYYLGFGSDNVGSYRFARGYGRSVRPVLRELFTLGFDANGGIGRMSAVELDRNESKNIPANTFTRHGYRFIGWNTAADGSGTAYTDQSTITPTANMTLYAQWENITSGVPDGHEWVDLGLPSGTKWATKNVGANSAEDYGDYFAWGETTPKSTYNWSTYKWCKGNSGTLTMTKYCTKSSDGTVDNKTTLDLSDDAAYVNWGGDWRMPTIEEQDELRNTNYTTWTWITQNGVNGYKVTSKANGNSIFLPAAGYRDYSDLDDAGSGGDYWSSSLNTGYLGYAYRLSFYSGRVGSIDYYRYKGYSVRPVLRE